MWPFNKNDMEMRKNNKELSDSLNVLASSVQKILQDQRSLRGLVNRKLGNKLEDDEDAGSPVSNRNAVIPASSNDLLSRFCIQNGVDPKILTPEMKSFVQETHEFREFAQSQSE